MKKDASQIFKADVFCHHFTSDFGDAPNATPLSKIPNQVLYYVVALANNLPDACEIFNLSIFSVSW